MTIRELSRYRRFKIRAVQDTDGSRYIRRMMQMFQELTQCTDADVTSAIYIRFKIQMVQDTAVSKYKRFKIQTFNI